MPALKQAAMDAPHLYAALDAKADEAALELERRGARAGSRIAVCMPPSERFFALLFGTLRIGAIFCPLNLRLPPAALAAQLERLNPHLFFSADGCEKRTALPSSLPFASFLLFTSGSTGVPKIALLSLENILASAHSAIQRCDFKAGDTWRLSLPLYHVGGLGIVFRALLARASFSFHDADLSITHLSYVPAQLYASWPVYPKLRRLLLGGSPIPEMPNELPCLASYGMTETASLVLAGKGPNSLQPLSGKEVKLAEGGELLVRGDSLFQGYWDGDTLHRPFDQEGWFATKDLGRFDKDLGFSIIGRKDNQFISGGENIQPEEIEKALLQIPGVFEAIVVPRADPRFGMRPVAWVRSVVDIAQIERVLLERLPKYKVPVAFFDLGRLPSGVKAQRKFLQNMSL